MSIPIWVVGLVVGAGGGNGRVFLMLGSYQAMKLISSIHSTTGSLIQGLASKSLNGLEIWMQLQ